LLAATTGARAAGTGGPSDAQLVAGHRPAAGTTEAELWYGMSQAEKELRTSPLLVRDPELNAYVRDVLCKVSGDYCGDLRLYLLDVPVFNASMAPNGVTIVFTGALLRMRNEAELAYVLAHEFAHYKARHSLQSWEKTKRTTAFLSTFSLFTLGLDGGLSGSLAYMMGLGGLASHSRDKEREADAIGFQAAAAAGYDPQAVVAMWQRVLEEEQADPRYKKGTGAFASHPKTQERIEDNRQAAAAVSQGHTGWQLGQERHQQQQDRFLAHWLEQEIGRRKYDVSLEVIGEVDEGIDAGDRAITTFYLAEAHRRRDRAGDRAAALDLYRQSIALPGAPAAAWREYGLAEYSLGNRDAARQSLQRYLALAPNAEDAPYINQYIHQTETES